MKTNKQNIILYIISIMFLGFLTNCQKQEFLPEPIGKEVPEMDAPSLTDIIKTEANLFFLAWEKANMTNYINSEHAQSQYTYLIPNNDAMEKAGFTESKIKEYPVEELQKIIKFHILNSQITSKQLSKMNMDMTGYTLYNNPKYFNISRAFGASNVKELYQFRHYLNVIKGQFYINGKPLSITKEKNIKEGNLMVISEVLKINDNQMIDVLTTNKQFSMYLKALELSLPAYRNVLFAGRWNIFFRAPLHYLIDVNYYFEGSAFENNSNMRGLINFTLYAPINEAFYELGLKNEDDLKALLNRGKPIQYRRGETTPLDSLLRVHASNMRGAVIRTSTPEISPLTNQPYIFGLVVNGKITGVQFFTTAFDEVYFPTMIRTVNLDNNQKPNPSYYDKKYKHEDGKIKVTDDDSDVKDVIIVEGNFNSVQGPVHAVNKIFVPKGFTMWHLKK